MAGPTSSTGSDPSQARVLQIIKLIVILVQQFYLKRAILELSPPIFKRFGYVGIYGISTLVNVVGILYLIFFVKETLPADKKAR